MYYIRKDGPPFQRARGDNRGCARRLHAVLARISEPISPSWTCSRLVKVSRPTRPLIPAAALFFFLLAAGSLSHAVPSPHSFPVLICHVHLAYSCLFIVTRFRKGSLASLLVVFIDSRCSAFCAFEILSEERHHRRHRVLGEGQCGEACECAHALLRTAGYFCTECLELARACTFMPCIASSSMLTAHLCDY